MIRNIGVVLLTLALGLVNAPSKEADGHERDSILKSLDQMAHTPVIVKVSVLNKETGGFVPNLRSEDFIIEENGERQKPTRFLQEERPLSILLLLDHSGSMRPIMHEIIEGVSNGLGRLKLDDEVALIAFNDYVNILQDFTKNKTLVTEKLRGVVASRSTLTSQALLQAATHILNATAADSHRIIVMITDNRQSTSPGEVLPEKTVVMQRLSACGSVVSGVVASYDDPQPQVLFPKKATDDSITPYVVETGGIVETVKKIKPEEISSRLTKTIDAFRNYYWIEYYPTDSKRDGSHRKLKVTLSPDVIKDRSKLTVLAKRGYYAPSFATSAEKK
jgi:hypothetical protein